MEILSYIHEVMDDYELHGGQQIQTLLNAIEDDLSDPDENPDEDDEGEDTED